MSAPALGILELSSIARGVVVHDAMLKRALVKVLRAHPISPGRYLVIVRGGVAEVEEAMAAGRDVADSFLHDQLILTQVHEQVLPAIAQGVQRVVVESLGLLETDSIAGAVLGADAAVKGADVTLIQLRLAAGLGGKGVVLIGGDVDAVEAGLEAAEAVVPGGIVGREIIRSPHPDFFSALL